MSTKNKFEKFLDIVSWITFIPIFVLAIISCILMLNAKKHNEVPSIFGYSAVKIISASMVEDGFLVGDVVMVKKVDTSKLVKGDIIAFYEVIGDDAESQEQAALHGSRVIFHKIANFDENKEYFSTENAIGIDDRYAVNKKMIVGVYTPSLFPGFISFSASSAGLISLVIIPSGILLMILSYSLVSQITAIIEENYVKKSKILGAGQTLKTQSATNNLNSTTARRPIPPTPRVGLKPMPPRPPRKMPPQKPD
ncbi:MAG: hypothetical protein RR140_02890 [Clostridia bacterium]